MQLFESIIISLRILIAKNMGIYLNIEKYLHEIKIHMSLHSLIIIYILMNLLVEVLCG